MSNEKVDEIYDYVNDVIEEHNLDSGVDLGLGFSNHNIGILEARTGEYKYGMLSVNDRYHLRYYVLDASLDSIFVKMYKKPSYHNISSTKLGFAERLDGMIESTIRFRSKMDFGEYLVFLDNALNYYEKKEIIKNANLTVKEAYEFLEQITSYKNLDVYYEDLNKKPVGKKGNIKSCTIKFGRYTLVYSAYLVRPELMRIRMYKNDDPYFNEKYGIISGVDNLMNRIELSKLVITLNDEILVKHRKMNKLIEVDVEPLKIVRRGGKKEVGTGRVHSNFKDMYKYWTNKYSSSKNTLINSIDAWIA